MTRLNHYKLWSLGTFSTDLPWIQSATTMVSVAENEVARAFREWIEELLPPLRKRVIVDVRSPYHRHSVYTEITGSLDDADALDWHKDGIGNAYLVLWSNSIGTDIATPKRRVVYRAKPGEVVAFDNDYFRHRTPRNLTVEQAKERWFIRTVLSRMQTVPKEAKRFQDTI